MIRETLSKEALDMIASLPKQPVVAVETLEHDGYDEEGPKSDIWDLYLVHRDTRRVTLYHREDWYSWGTQRDYKKEKSDKRDKRDKKDKKDNLYVEGLSGPLRERLERMLKERN